MRKQLAAFLTLLVVGLALIAHGSTTSALTPTQRTVLFSSPGCGVPETNLLIAQMTVKPTSVRQALLTSTICQLKTSGIWYLSDVIYGLAAHTQQASLLNWKLPGTFTATVNGTVGVDITFDVDQGWTSQNAGGYVNTGWNPATNGVRLQRDSAHGTVVVGTAVVDAANFAISAGAQFRMTPKNGTTGSARINTTTLTQTATRSSNVGQTTGVRNVSTEQRMFVDGGAANVVASSSLAVQSATLLIGSNTTVSYPGRIAWVGAGGALTDAQVARYNQIVAAYPQ